MVQDSIKKIIIFFEKDSKEDTQLWRTTTKAPAKWAATSELILKMDISKNFESYCLKKHKRNKKRHKTRKTKDQSRKMDKNNLKIKEEPRTLTRKF